MPQMVLVDVSRGTFFLWDVAASKREKQTKRQMSKGKGQGLKHASYDPTTSLPEAQGVTSFDKSAGPGRFSASGFHSRCRHQSAE